MLDTISRIKRIFLDRLHVRANRLDTDLLESGVLDSMTLVDLLLGLELEFGIQVMIAELDFDNFRSLDRIAALVDGQVKAKVA
jgi:D-alanine--poly(phosphoribitol) ligase subunit 2